MKQETGNPSTSKDPASYPELYIFFGNLENNSGYLTPYVPTPDYLTEDIINIMKKLLSKTASQPIIYEPGCGKAKVLSEVVKRLKAYAICLELNNLLALQAHKMLLDKHIDLLADVVIGDLGNFKLRKTDLVYAYLLPNSIIILEKTLPKNTIILSLDYKGGKTPINKLRIKFHELHIIRT